MSEDTTKPVAEATDATAAKAEPAPVEPAEAAVEVAEAVEADVAEAPTDVTFTPDRSIPAIVNGRVYPLAAGVATTVPVAVKEVYDGWRADQ